MKDLIPTNLSHPAAFSFFMGLSWSYHILLVQFILRLLLIILRLRMPELLILAVLVSNQRSMRTVLYQFT